jgi:hypothetical protein
MFIVKFRIMKVLKLTIIGFVMFLASSVQSQVSVNINLPSPPLWGPAGYTHVRYYYLPDVEAYYDIQTSMFIYYGGGAWVHRANLPSRYRGYDLYGGYKVVMSDYRGNTPYIYFKGHKQKYGRGFHGNAQKTIGERPGKGNQGRNNSHEVIDRKKGNGHNNARGESRGNSKNADKSHGNGKRK